MALLAWLLEQNGTERPRPAPPVPAIRFKTHPAPRCPNPGCISRHEGAYLVPRFRLGRSTDSSTLPLVCEFCERELKIEFVGHARTRRYYRFDRNLYGYVRSWIEESSLAVFESVKQAEESDYEPYRRGPQREIMNADEVAAACRALATQMTADLPDLASVTLVGVVSHGAMLAMRLRDLIEAETHVRPPCAALDVFGGEAAFHPLDGGGGPPEVENRTIVLVDDVINSGWTVQRAMTALWQRGRPAAVKLAVLIDRGHRAVPIRPNYVGKNIPTARAERVQVRLAAPEGATPGRAKAQDRVVIYSMVESLKEGEDAG
jgi:pyrimidine operon attenuation protein/uracil phosphoribosyltransferase